MSDEKEALTGSERRLRLVAALSAVVMLGEIASGFWSGSLSLVAEGFHMFAHVGAFSVAAFAFWYARTRAPGRLVFGRGKVHALAAFSNGALLIAVALLTVVEAIERLIEPQPIRFDQALWVAGAGLVFNIVSLGLIGHRPGHDHSHHGHAHHHDHPHDDNLRAAYLHLVGDLLSGLGAIAALLAGRYLKLAAADPIVALLTSAVVARWGARLCGSVARYLVDERTDDERETRLLGRLRERSPLVTELALWEVSPNRFAALLTVSGPVADPGALAAVLREDLAFVEIAFHFATASASGEP